MSVVIRDSKEEVQFGAIGGGTSLGCGSSLAGYEVEPVPFERHPPEYRFLGRPLTTRDDSRKNR
jgi:hypothetical protein